MLSTLGIHKVTLPLPFQGAGGRVNLYLLEKRDGSVALFDAGLGSPDSDAVLDGALASLGLTHGDISAIYIGHGHIDHYGGAQRLAERSGAPVYIHPHDREKVLEECVGLRPTRPQRDYLSLLGLPLEVLEEVAFFFREMAKDAPPLREVRPLKLGATLEFKHFEARFLHSPGHTPGLVSLHAPEPNLLFVSDHLLESISPNPVLDLFGDHIVTEAAPNPYRALEQHLASLEQTRALAPVLILPGHGEPFTDYGAAIAMVRNVSERRGARLLAALTGTGPATPFELIPALFGKRREGDTFLMLSEVVGNLEVLEREGRVRRALEGGVLRFAVG